MVSALITSFVTPTLRESVKCPQRSWSVVVLLLPSLSLKKILEHSSNNDDDDNNNIFL